MLMLMNSDHSTVLRVLVKWVVKVVLTYSMQMLVDNSSLCVPQQFSSDIADNASTVCLAHLFTYQDFDEGTLGLAYVAPSKPQALGGLCPKRKDTSLSGKLLCFDQPNR